MMNMEDGQLVFMCPVSEISIMIKEIMCVVLATRAVRAGKIEP